MELPSFLNENMFSISRFKICEHLMHRDGPNWAEQHHLRRGDAVIEIYTWNWEWGSIFSGCIRHLIWKRRRSMIPVKVPCNWACSLQNQYRRIKHRHATITMHSQWPYYINNPVVILYKNDKRYREKQMSRSQVLDCNHYSHGCINFYNAAAIVRSVRERQCRRQSP